MCIQSELKQKKSTGYGCVLTVHHIELYLYYASILQRMIDVMPINACMSSAGYLYWSIKILPGSMKVITLIELG